MGTKMCFKSIICIFSFDGYLGSEETILDDAGWLHTGDVVYRDNDGNLVFVDRIKSLIKCDAKHVQPSEIENMIECVYFISFTAANYSRRIW